MFEETLVIIVDRLIDSGLSEEQALMLIAELLASAVPFDHMMNLSSVSYS